MIISGAEPFLLPGNNKKGVLLLHGYTGCPAEIRELGERLHEEGYSVYGPLLPGHGTDPNDLDECTWQDWYLASKTAFYELQHSTEEIYVIGMSMGSLLTLMLGAKLPCKKLVLMSTPIYLFDRRIHFLWILKYFIKAITKGVRNIDAPECYNVSYDILPVSGVIEVVKLIKICKEKIIPKVTIPCLIIQSKTEHTVKPKSATYIFQHLGSKLKEVFWLEHSKHVVTLYEQREEVFEKISQFLKE